MNNPDCIFCKIASGLIPVHKIYEDSDTFAFLDQTPVNPGHALVIPKAHYENIYEVPDEIIGKMMQDIKKLGHALKDGLGIENANIMMNNGKFAGQTVFHAHIHFVPRHENDGRGNLWKGEPYKEGEAEVVALKIKNAL